MMHTELAYTLSTDGWTRTMRPLMEDMQKNSVALLTVPQDKRANNESDEFLRGYFHALAFALTHWDALLREQEAKLVNEKAAAEVPIAAGSPYVDNAAPPTHANGVQES